MYKNLVYTLLHAVSFVVPYPISVGVGWCLGGDWVGSSGI
jgi:hypothetical protein